MQQVPQEILDEIAERNREMLIREHGLVKAEEILLNRELGELTCELDAEEMP